MDTWHGKAKFINGKGDVYEGGELSVVYIFLCRN